MRHHISSHWKKTILKRDSYTCQDCGTKERSVLTVHHIIPISMAPEMKMDPNNGITLCRPCHDKQHTLMARLGIEQKPKKPKKNLWGLSLEGMRRCWECIKLYPENQVCYTTYTGKRICSDCWQKYYENWAETVKL